MPRCGIPGSSVPSAPVPGARVRPVEGTRLGVGGLVLSGDDVLVGVAEDVAGHIEQRGGVGIGGRHHSAEKRAVAPGDLLHDRVPHALHQVSHFGSLVALRDTQPAHDHGLDDARPRRPQPDGAVVAGQVHHPRGEEREDHGEEAEGCDQLAQELRHAARARQQLQEHGRRAR